jgi:hypothetical protein
MPELVTSAISLFFAWLFAVSAWHKLRHPGYYRDLLRSWFVSGPPWLQAWPLAVLELLIALSLLLPGSRSGALMLAALLLLLYAAGMAWQLLRGRSSLKCGCAGPAADSTISHALVWRNLVCAQLAVLAARPVSGELLRGPDIAAAALCAAFMCLFYLCCEQLISNAQHFATEKK